MNIFALAGCLATLNEVALISSKHSLDHMSADME